MTKYATGRKAFGRCQRCGDKVAYLKLRFDGQNPNLRVCGPCVDTKHPQEKAFNATDSEMLRHPAPDTDNDAAGDGGTLAATVFSGLNYFGGGT